ncbi:MAG: DUF3185 family protein [Pseudohongiellaceae bacterium]
MATNQLVGIVLVVLGLVLLYFGWQASQSMADQVTESFTGRFTDGTMWYIIGGAVSLAAGAFVVLRK